MPKKFFLWAHRGASAVAPENTLAAFRAAEAAGADGIELDVHLSRDGVPVVIHDQTLERTTDGRGTVGSFNFLDLRRLDAGSWFSPRFAGEPVPELAEVLAWTGDRLRLNIEIKNVESGDAVLKVLRAHPHCRVLVSSFDHRLLAAMRAADPDLPLGVLIEVRFWRRALATAWYCRAESLHPRQEHVNKGMVEACHRNGLKVFPWTVDDLPILHRLLRLGVDGVFTNSPASLASFSFHSCPTS